MKRAVTFSPQAREQARGTAVWWRDNRPAARGLFAAELRRALTLISHVPTIGVSYSHPNIEGVRRLVLSSTRAHVYYVHNEVTDAIEVVGLWGAIRGHGPTLRR